MTGDAEKLNGSVELLARAMRKVFSEAVEGAAEPLHEDMKGLRTDMQGMSARMATKADIKTTNENMQYQFAEQEKKIGQLLKARR